MATYYDGLNDFYKLNEQEPLASSAQLVYLHLLQLNNRHGNSGSVQISDRELGRLTSLNKNTITQAKRTLKNLKLIDFSSDRAKPHRGTCYSLTYFDIGQTLGQTLGQSVGQSIGQSVGHALSNYPSLSIVEEDLRKKEKETTHTAHTRTRDTYEEDILLDEWEAAGGCKPNFMLISRLKNLLMKYGLEKMKTALELANRKANGNYGFSLEFFENQLFGGNNQSQKTTQTGGEKVEQPTDSRLKWAYSD